MRPRHKADATENRHARGRHTHLALIAVAIFGCNTAEGDTRDAPAPQATSAPVPTEAGAASRRPGTGHAWVIFGADTVVAEVAATPEERQKGLMYREEVPDGTGMLFVFQSPSIQSFWMANTYVALDNAYMDAGYTIVNIVQMEPLVTDSYPSAAPAMFALEVRQGWFEEHGIRAGATAEIVFGN